MDRVLVNAQRLRPRADREGKENARREPEQLRRDLRDARRRLGTEAVDRYVGLRRRSVFHARRYEDSLAALRRAGSDRRRVDDESGWHRSAADHGLRIHELGTVHAPLRQINFFRIKQARLGKLRGFHRRRGGHQGAGARDLLGWLRRSAGPVARRQDAGVDLEPVRRIGGTALSRAVEPRKGARSFEERAAEETEQEVMKKFFFVAVVTVVAQGFSPALSAQSKTKPHVETLASPKLEGRLAGSSGEKLASDYIVAELQKIGAKPLPGKSDFRLPFDFTAGTRDG